MKVTIGGNSLDLIAAKTPKERETGLLNTKSIPEDGMALIFPENDEITIHTIGMTYPIDVIFVNNNRVKSIHPLLPNNRVSDFADLVIEIEFGKAEELGIQKGMEVKKSKSSIRKKAIKMKEGGKIKIIGEKGEVVKEVDDEVRIVSRRETKKLFELASRSTKKSNIELGRFIVKVINGQDNRPQETVSIKE